MRQVIRQLARVVPGAAAAFLVIPGCTYPGPNPAEFGYKLTSAGDVLIAYPLCAGSSVYGAAVDVRVSEDDVNVKRVWQAEDPVSDRVAEGLFTVGGTGSFRHERQPMRGSLPDLFFVTVQEKDADRLIEGLDAPVDLTRLEGVSLNSDQFMTEPGKVLTRQQIDAQIPCRSEIPS
jgi:hypothetical protein